MATWILPSNTLRYDATAAFRKLGKITWNLTYKRMIQVGDTVYLYATAPAKRLVARTIVTSVPGTQIPDEAFWFSSSGTEVKRGVEISFDIELDQWFSPLTSGLLTLDRLKRNGLKTAPQSLHELPDDTSTYIHQVLLRASNALEPEFHSSIQADGLTAEFLNRISRGDFHVEDTYRSTKSRGPAQRAFSIVVKGNYGYRCAITGIQDSSFLIAAHIVPWSHDKSIRVDPTNGISLSPLVDRAYEYGQLLIHPNLRIEVSSRLQEEDPALYAELSKYDGKKLTPPLTSSPEPEYLQRRLDLVRGHTTDTSIRRFRPKITGKD